MHTTRSQTDGSGAEANDATALGAEPEKPMQRHPIVNDPTPSASAIRVLMITSQWPPPGQPHTAHFIKRQAEFLRAAGVDVDVFHFKGEGNPRNYWKAWVEVHRRLRHNSYDLVHAQWGHTGLVALPTRLPLVVTLRGTDIAGVLGRNLRLTPGGRVLRLISQGVSRAADAVIVVSEHMKAFLHPTVRPYVIPTGLDFSVFRPLPRDAARQRLGMTLDKRLVLFIGRPEIPLKRFSLARQAVEILNRRLPAELVVAWGVPYAEMPFYLNACDALVFTSVQEGSPNAVKEALACNLPVVSVPVGDVAARLDGVMGCELCPDDRPETIAAALERVLRQGGRSAGRKAVRSLDERLTTRQVLAVYRSVLKRRPDRSERTAGLPFPPPSRREGRPAAVPGGPDRRPVEPARGSASRHLN